MCFHKCTVVFLERVSELILGFHNYLNTLLGVLISHIGLPTTYDDNYGEPRVTHETRTKNMTVRLWKRIN